MLPTVELDDQGMIGADKIRDERAELNLATVFNAKEAAIAQPRP